MRRALLRRSELYAIDLLLSQGMTSIYDMGRPALTAYRYPVSVVFAGMAAFCAETGTAPAYFAGAEGVTVRRGGTYLVLYDERVQNERRRAFTLAHEIGHILLSHSGEATATEEREANAFAAALLCPEVALRYIEHRCGEALTPARLTEHFFLSEEAAAARLRDIRRRPPRPPSSSEIALLLQLFGQMPDCIKEEKP